MAKSNMRSAGIRKHHRRIEHQARIDGRNQHDRIFHQKDHTTLMQQVITLSILSAVFHKFTNFMGRYVQRFFSPTTLTLDLTKDSPFSTDQRRDHGAQYLRSIWSNLGTMVSTRDGKVIR